MTLGPFMWTNVFLDNPGDDDPDDDLPGDDDGEDESDEPDWGLYIMIAVGSVVVIVIIVLVALFAASKLGGKKKDKDVIPEQKDMDYTQIPEFERRAPVQPQQVVTGTYQQPEDVPRQPVQQPPEQIQGNVNWEQDGVQAEETMAETAELEDPAGNFQVAPPPSQIGAPPEPPA